MTPPLSRTAPRRPAAKAAGDMLIYVYGVARPSADDPEPLSTIDGLIPDRPVRFIACDGLAAAVSEVPTAEFGETALKQKLQDVAWAKARVVDHHRVLMALPQATVLPFKFCTVFSDGQALIRALKQHGKNLKTAFDAVDGAREWGLKLFVDPDALGRHVRMTAPHLVQLTRKTGTASPGTAFFLKRRLADMVTETAAKTAGQWAQSIHKAVAQAAKAAAEQPVQPPSLHGRGTDMVLNAAYLVPRKAEGAFHRAIETVARRHAGTGLDFDVIGPMPPYSFVTIEAGLGAAGGRP